MTRTTRGRRGEKMTRTCWIMFTILYGREVGKFNTRNFAKEFSRFYED